MVMRYGMDETLGQAIYVEDQPRFLEGVIRPLGMGGIYSQETAREIDVAVRALIDRAFARATKILTCGYQIFHPARFGATRSAVT